MQPQRKVQEKSLNSEKIEKVAHGQAVAYHNYIYGKELILGYSLDRSEKPACNTFCTLCRLFPVFLPALEDLAGHLKWDTATAVARQLTGFNRDTRSFGTHNSPKHIPSFCEEIAKSLNMAMSQYMFTKIKP